MKRPGVGAVGMNAEVNIDETTGSTSIGNVVCLLIYGAGTGTVGSGDKLNVFYSGQLCGTGTATIRTSGTWQVVGGSGALTSANGTGFFALSHSNAFGSNPCVDTMDGTFRKTP
jgi:hypothetical protein